MGWNFGSSSQIALGNSEEFSRSSSRIQCTSECALLRLKPSSRFLLINFSSSNQDPNPGDSPVTGKVLQLFRPRPLWREGLLDLCVQIRLPIHGRPRTRYLSTWANDLKEAAQGSTQPPLSGRIHFIGMGNVGTFIAHSLAARPSPPPTTLLLHHQSFYQSFCLHKKRLCVNSNGLDDLRSGFEVEVYENGGWHMKEGNLKTTSDHRHGTGEPTREVGEVDSDLPIECLVVSCRANATPKILRMVKHRLNSNSTICLIQNGMGMVEKLNATVFTNPKTRPNYIQGIFTHGLSNRFPYGVAHRAVGALILSPVVTSQTPVVDAELDTHWAPSTKYILRVLSLTPTLVATVDTPAGFLVHQLERQVINSIIHPLTAINDCRAGELLYVYNATRIMRLLLYEMTAVINALPELQGVPGIGDRFSTERLRRLVTNQCALLAEMTTAMGTDIARRRPTEIEYFNGWFVRRGEDLGIKCVLNYMMMQLIQTKATVWRRREIEAIPIDVENPISTGDNHFED